jgi:ATP-dependent Clp endopeptidase proteolytic subunit ClpP
MKLSSEEKKEKEELSEQEESIIHVLNSALDKPELRVTGIYGDINEEKCSETVWGLLALHETGKKYFKEEDSDELVEEYTPIDFYISSYGGSAAEMFSVYDVIRSLRDRTPVKTYGVGKVMSAGVLLLASGTKGERRIGKHCRVMIHGVISGQHGHIADVKNEFEETKVTQKLYIDALAEETNMTRAYIKRLMNRKTNVYMDAQEAVELGIADIVF